MEWLKNRWYDFRNGHNLYLMYVLQFIQFTVILYSLTFLQHIFSSFQFVVFIVLSYVPLAIAVGYFVYRKRQLPTEQDAVFERSRLVAKVNLILLKAVLDEASDDEIEYAKNLLERIANGKV